SLRVSWPLLRVAEDVPGGRTRRYRRKAKASRMGRPGEVETGPTARGYSEHFIPSEPHPSVTHHLHRPPSILAPFSQRTRPTRGPAAQVSGGSHCLATSEL